MPETNEDERPRVLIAGGGIAGMEAALALAALAGDRVDVTLFAPDPDFFFKPMTVEEPFSGAPAERHELKAALADLGFGFRTEALASVDADAHVVHTASGAELPYDLLMVCVGGRTHPAYNGVETFWSNRSDIPVDDLIARAHAAERELNLVVPPGTTWPLPLYEVGLMIRRRTEELGLADVRMRMITPEDAPLGVFGTVASGALAELLRGRRIDMRIDNYVSEQEDGRLVVAPTHEVLDPKLVLTLPQMSGPGIEGLPADDDGFIPVDLHGRVLGVEDVYGAGDGTNFPVKQGGIATQLADAAAEDIAARVGALSDPQPFDPILRGQLLTGMESLNMKHELTGGHGEGVASLDYLWWPPQKVGGRYLASWLGDSTSTDLEPPSVPIDVQVSLPTSWHGTPMIRGADPD